MKYLPATIAFLLTLAAAAKAGANDKEVAPPATTENYGTGFYVAPEGGFNVYQDSVIAPPADVNGKTSYRSETGGFAGGKLGYVFNTGLLRPDIETDMFYNAYAGSSSKIFDLSSGFKGRDFRNYQVESGAFMFNGLLRLNLGRFQPYAGMGIGLYTASISRQLIATNYITGHTLSYTNQPSSPTDWAWQVVAGADYYLKPNISLFAEYKFLNYMNAYSSQAPQGGRAGQQLIGFGVRWFF